MQDIIYEMKNIVPVNWNERIKFECCRCGACCRHVKDSVPLENLDVYRLAKYLKSHDEEFISISDMLSQYATPVPLHKCGYFIYALRTVGKEDTCIFLKNNQCTVQPAKPRACRTYPLVAEPDGASSFNYYLSTEKPHHFAGRKFKARNWMRQYFTEEDQTFIQMDFASALPIAKLLKKIPETRKPEALLAFMACKYTDYHLDQPFLEQYEQNNKKLMASLEALIH